MNDELIFPMRKKLKLRPFTEMSLHHDKLVVATEQPHQQP